MDKYSEYSSKKRRERVRRRKVIRKKKKKKLKNSLGKERDIQSSKSDESKETQTKTFYI